MNTNTCADLADLLPEWVAGRLDASDAASVAEHVAGCRDCAAQVDLLRSLAAARPEAPAGFADRISRAFAEDAGSRRIAPPRRVRPAWAVSAAAVLVLAVGTAVVTRRASPPTEATVAASALGEVVDDESQVWIVDDGAVAGAPVLDDLSDEALATLAEELGA